MLAVTSGRRSSPRGRLPPRVRRRAAGRSRRRRCLRGRRPIRRSRGSRCRCPLVLDAERRRSEDEDVLVGAAPTSHREVARRRQVDAPGRVDRRGVDVLVRVRAGRRRSRRSTWRTCRSWSPPSELGVKARRSSSLAGDARSRSQSRAVESTSFPVREQLERVDVLTRCREADVGAVEVHAEGPGRRRAKRRRVEADDVGVVDRARQRPGAWRRPCPARTEASRCRASRTRRCRRLARPTSEPSNERLNVAAPLKKTTSSLATVTPPTVPPFRSVK